MYAYWQRPLTCKDYSRPWGVGFRGGVGDGDEGADIASQAATQLTALHALLPPWHCLQLLQVPVHCTMLSSTTMNKTQHLTNCRRTRLMRNSCSSVQAAMAQVDKCPSQVNRHQSHRRIVQLNMFESSSAIDNARTYERSDCCVVWHSMALYAGHAEKACLMR